LLRAIRLGREEGRIDPEETQDQLRWATSVFRDPLAVIFDDEDHSADEGREIIIGHSLLNRLVLVCFTERQDGDVRIFSARKLSSKERKDYEKSKSVKDS